MRARERANMVILALDQATTTGWAVTDADGQILGSGVWHLVDKKRTGESRGMRYVRFETELRKAIQTWNPDLIVHEQTLLRGGAATEIANGLKALILKVAEENSLNVSCVHTSELKHWATGNGAAEKAEMIAAAIRFRLFQWSGPNYHPLIDDNEADATLIALWGSERYGAFQGPKWPDKKKASKRRKGASRQT